MADREYDDHEYAWLDNAGNEWRDCCDCGGEGFHDGECTCMDDCCCCLTPDPPTCRTCRGTGSMMVKSAQDKDADALRQILADALAKTTGASDHTEDHGLRRRGSTPDGGHGVCDDQRLSPRASRSMTNPITPDELSSFETMLSALSNGMAAKAVNGDELCDGISEEDA